MVKQFELPTHQNVTDQHSDRIKTGPSSPPYYPNRAKKKKSSVVAASLQPVLTVREKNMKTTCGRTSPVVAAVLVALAVVAAAVGPAPKRRGQEIHLFEATVRFPDDGVDELDYNYRLLAKVLGRSHAWAWLMDLSILFRDSSNFISLFFTLCFFFFFLLDDLSVEAARRATYDSELGVFSALITNNQARRLSSELNPYQSIYATVNYITILDIKELTT